MTAAPLCRSAILFVGWAVTGCASVDPAPIDLVGVDVQIVPAVPTPGQQARCDTPGAPQASWSWHLDGVPFAEGEAVTTPDAVGSRLACQLSTGDSPHILAADEVVIGPSVSPGNILVLLVDDVGVERVGAYGMGTAPPPTKNIDRLADEGVRFTRAWATPTCSPTRATLISGRYGFRTGFGKASNAKDGWSLPDDQPSIGEWVRDSPAATYTSAVLGKWHLSNFASGHGEHPVSRGFDIYRGNPGNLRQEEAVDGGTQGFYDYEYTDEDGLRRQSVYLTTSEANDAIELAQTLPEPWFLYVSFHASHIPVHTPPRALYSGPDIINTEATELRRFDAMTEALDREIGRILDVVDPSNTTVIFLSDNGTEPDAASGPYPRGEVKMSMFEGGVRVPLIITGPSVLQPGSVSDALVHTSDVFATIAQLAGTPVEEHAAEVDGVSLLPFMVDPDRPSIREVVYTERFFDNGYGPYSVYRRAIRDDRYKLVTDADEGDTFHDLGMAWEDGPNLLDAGGWDDEAERAYLRLRGWLDGPTFRP